MCVWPCTLLYIAYGRSVLVKSVWSLLCCLWAHKKTPKERCMRLQLGAYRFNWQTRLEHAFRQKSAKFAMTTTTRHGAQTSHLRPIHTHTLTLTRQRQTIRGRPRLLFVLIFVRHKSPQMPGIFCSMGRPQCTHTRQRSRKFRDCPLAIFCAPGAACAILFRTCETAAWGTRGEKYCHELSHKARVGLRLWLAKVAHRQTAQSHMRDRR